MKNRLLLFIAGCCSLLLSSCFDSDSDVEYIMSKDCEITAFSLSNDSIPGLSDVKFTIDQIKGRIYNMDSLPCGTVLNRKAACSLSFAGTVVECKIMQEATGDTIKWEDVDSLDFSKPVKFVTKLWDGQTTKGYLAQVNIHTVVPDSMEWSCHAKHIADYPIENERVVTFTAENDEKEQYYMFVEPKYNADSYKLFCSPVSDGANWTEHNVNGLPIGDIVMSQITAFKGGIYAISKQGDLYTTANGTDWSKVENTPVLTSILGTVDTNDKLVTSSQNSVLSVIAEKEGRKYFSCMTDKGIWLPENDEEIHWVPQTFPVKGFANVSFYAMYCARLSLVGGLMQKGGLTNQTWGTTDGLNWQNITSTADKAVPFRGIDGASIVEYDNMNGKENCFFMVGGFDSYGNSSSAIYRTTDGGMTWALSDTLVVMPDKFKARGGMSIHVNKDNYMYLFGGKEKRDNEVTDEVWRGRINRLGFDFNPLN